MGNFITVHAGRGTSCKFAVWLPGDSSPQNQKDIFFLLPIVLFISLDSFGVSCLVLEISAVEIAFSQI